MERRVGTAGDDRNAATILAARQLGYNGEILALVEEPYHRQPIILAGVQAVLKTQLNRAGPNPPHA